MNFISQNFTIGVVIIQHEGGLAPEMDHGFRVEHHVPGGEVENDQSRDVVVQRHRESEYLEMIWQKQLEGSIDLINRLQHRTSAVRIG
jgi:hypothetical protein